MSDLATIPENISGLFYGGPGSGKSAIIVSAFWDWQKRKQIRKGVWLQFGQEHNPALAVPEELIVRFSSPIDEPLKFVDEVGKWLKKTLRASRRGEGPEVIAWDGWSEWNIIFQNETVYDPKDQWGGWRHMKEEFISQIQMLRPKEMGCHILATARVDMRKKGTEKVEGDPDWMDAKYYPSMQGWARTNLPHYSDLVVYMDQDMGMRTLPSGAKRRAPIHKAFVVPSGDFWIKNNWEDEWVTTQEKDFLVNPSFDNLMSELQGAVNKARG